MRKPVENFLVGKTTNVTASEMLRAIRGRGAAGFLTGIHACSACPGDYEDPDRTAWRFGDDAEAGERSEGDLAGDAASLVDEESSAQDD